MHQLDIAVQVSALQGIPVQQATYMITIGLVIVIISIQLQMLVVDLEAAKLKGVVAVLPTYMLE